MLKYLKPQSKRAPKQTENKTKNITTQLQVSAFVKFSTSTRPLKIEFVTDSGTLQWTIWHRTYFCNYFRTLKLWLLVERPQDMVNTAKIIEGSLFEMFYLTLSNLIQVNKSQWRRIK